MKLFLLLSFQLIVLAIGADAYAIFDLPASVFSNTQAFFANGTECKDKVGASEDDVQEFFKTKNPKLRNAQCLGACMLERMEMLNEGRFNHEMFAAIVKRFLGPEDTMGDLFSEIAKSCSKTAATKTTDNCEAAVILSDCVDKYTEKFRKIVASEDI